MVLGQRAAAFVAALGLLGCPNQEEAVAPASGEIRVFYLPFSVETFLPVTVDSIEEDAKCKFSFRPTNEDIATLRDLLSRVIATGFDRKRVRLKLVGLEEVALYVDAEGGVQKEHGKIGRLEPSALSAMEAYIETTAIGAGCDPHR